MSRAQLPSELRDLIERVAVLPHGLGFLHQVYLESVAVTLGVHPFVVDAARRYMATPEGRAVMIEEVRLARRRMAVDTDRAHGDAASSTAKSMLSRADAASPPGNGAKVPGRSAEIEPEELIEDARSHPLGLQFLVNAPPETVAITFGVHPFLVFRARGLISSRADLWGDESGAGR